MAGYVTCDFMRGMPPSVAHILSALALGLALVRDAEGEHSVRELMDTTRSPDLFSGSGICQPD